MDRADYATACRAGAAAAGAPVRRRRLSAVRRPAGRAAHTTGSRAGADAPDRRRRLRTARRAVERSGLRVRVRGRGPILTTAHSTAASGPQQTPSRAPGTGPRLHCQSADGPRGRPRPPRPATWADSGAGAPSRAPDSGSVAARWPQCCARRWELGPGPGPGLGVRGGPLSAVLCVDALRRREFFQEVAKVVTFQLWDG